MTDTELAWAAGVLEGEGSIRINKPTRRNMGALLVTVTSTDTDMIVPFVRWWPACMLRQPKVKAHHRHAYVWVAAARTAAAFLRAVRPFIRTARIREKIELALEFQEQKSSSHAVNRTPEYLARQIDYYERMRALNVKGRAPRIIPA